MELTLETVKELLKDADDHCLEISETDDGIRIYKEEWGHEDSIVGLVMNAALALKLDPEQVRSNVYVEEGTPDTMGVGFDYMVVDISFLRRRTKRDTNQRINS